MLCDYFCLCTHPGSGRTSNIEICCSKEICLRAFPVGCHTHPKYTRCFRRQKPLATPTIVQFSCKTSSYVCIAASPVAISRRSIPCPTDFYLPCSWPSPP
uniref:Uncharacterized protein n=1 Tax=Cacopsylla melanoneura TaxID=428564 RepID=A0A8D8ZCB2_9HEMI